jgi:L-fuconolactonase
MHQIIDTHIHIWNFSKARYEWLENDTTILNRNYEIDELEPARKKAGITGGVLVQAANNLEEMDWMLEVATATQWLQGVVGWLPLTDPAATEKLLNEKYLQHPYFKGIRHLIHDEKDPRWLLQPTVIESLSLLAKHHIPYDVVGVQPQHIETAIEVANRIPGLHMIFDHLNQPPMNNDFGRWGELMQEAAKHKNFFVKISGLGTASKKFNSWAVEDIKPCIEFVLQHFGEQRCCCGGDWPVSLLAGSYEDTWAAYKKVLSEILNEKNQEKVFSLNANLIYNLKLEDWR